MTKWYIINVVAGQENKICDDINNIAKTNENIKEAFIMLVKKIMKGGQSYIEGMSLNDSKMSYAEEEKGHCCGK